MRLSKQETTQIIKALSPFIHGRKAEIRLYGSRTNNNLKGGDIDLLLLVNHTRTAENLLAQKHKMLAQIKYLIGEQHVDLKIATRKACEEDPFLQVILPTSVLLHTWP